jgi:hypothetical protein
MLFSQYDRGAPGILLFVDWSSSSKFVVSYFITCHEFNSDQNINEKQKRNGNTYWNVVEFIYLTSLSAYNERITEF